MVWNEFICFGGKYHFFISLTFVIIILKVTDFYFFSYKSILCRVCSKVFLTLFDPPPPFEKSGILFCTVWQTVCRPSDVRLISFDAFDWKGINLVLWMPLESWCSLLVFRSHFQRSGSNCRSFKNCCALNITWLPC